MKGKLALSAPAGPFTLTARADRIDIGQGGLVITDYKTGAGVQNLATRATEGRAPQLPLEAAIAAAGGFAGVPAGAGEGSAIHLDVGRRAAGAGHRARADDVARWRDDGAARLEAPRGRVRPARRRPIARCAGRSSTTTTMTTRIWLAWPSGQAETEEED